MLKYREEFCSSLFETLNERQQSYGDPSESMKHIADMWSSYHERRITPQEMVSMMIMLKLGRLKETPCHLDSWLDIAGYAAIAYESILCEIEDEEAIDDPSSDMESIDDEEMDHDF